MELITATGSAVPAWRALEPSAPQNLHINAQRVRKKKTTHYFFPTFNFLFMPVFQVDTACFRDQNTYEEKKKVGSLGMY